jgi:hydrogenase maturation protease
MHSEAPKILVLGVGNILFTDEGIGVRVVEHLQDAYDFSDNVTLMAGGTLGLRLMDPIMQCERLIVVDAVFGGSEPGSLYRLTDENLRKSLAFKNSMHQTDLVDTLINCELLGSRPEAVVIGIEPFDLKTMHVGVSEGAAALLPKMAEFVLDEIVKSGGAFTRKAA